MAGPQSTRHMVFRPSPMGTLLILTRLWLMLIPAFSLAVTRLPMAMWLVATRLLELWWSVMFVCVKKCRRCTARGQMGRMLFVGAAVFAVSATCALFVLPASATYTS